MRHRKVVACLLLIAVCCNSGCIGLLLDAGHRVGSSASGEPPSARGLMNRHLLGGTCETLLVLLYVSPWAPGYVSGPQDPTEEDMERCRQTALLFGTFAALDFWAAYHYHKKSKHVSLVLHPSGAAVMYEF